MKTNEQTKNEQLTKESLILKGIAGNIQSMHFPKFQNLEEMFSCFNYEIKITEKIADINNSVFAFLSKHKDIKSQITHYELEAAQKNGGNIASVYTGILKKITLCENTMCLYMNMDESILVNFDSNHERYFRIITFLSERDNVLASDLPIWKYKDKTYSVDDIPFKSESQLYSFFYETTDIWMIYQIKIINDGTIILRGCKEKK
jgi:hypothetical protein